ncbi:class I adenylate-forming enzyme family protein [Kribbia dieselivorans]|uniref:class I adenylate-forming enzyme family protein n=1 Tax=Kribbia dieselivorans TaxID=331526 RepID=UPI000AFFFE2D|nr:AMP-binding protein [Kribbia dieselivorans]
MPTMISDDLAHGPEHTTGYWPTGVPRHLEYPDHTVADLHTWASARYGDRLAVVDGAQSLTFAQLHALACRIAHGLRGQGVQPGDAVLLHQPNSMWFLPTYFGIHLAGAIVVPTNPLQPEAVLRHQIALTGATAAISHPAHAHALAETAVGTSIGTLAVVPATTAAPGRADLPDGVISIDDLIEGQPVTRPQVPTTDGDIAHLAFTGGTTGVPKAVRMLHRNIVANVAQMVAWRSGHTLGGRGGQVALTPLPGVDDPPVAPGACSTVVVSPLFHTHALVNMTWLHLCGATHVLLGRFDAPLMLDLMDRHQTTYVTGSPTMWHGLVAAAAGRDHDFGSLRVVATGAAPTDAPTLAALAKLFPRAVTVESCGLTECTCLVSAGVVVRGGRNQPGSAGLPVCDTEVEARVGGIAVAPGERGELWVRGPQVTDGYLNRPAETAEQYVDGWVNTGDIGYVDDEGFVHISDRSKDMLIYKGYNVYPRELEAVLLEHADVDAAAVVGRPAGAVGQEPVAFVVGVPGATIDPDGLMAHVAARVLPYQKVRQVHVVEALPSNAAGKILKAELRQRLE